MTISSEQMAAHFGIPNIAACAEVVETLSQKDGAWEMARTYRYADGQSLEFAEKDSEYYTLMPAVPGWEILLLPVQAEPTADAIERRPITAWRYDNDPQGSTLMPFCPGEQSRYGDAVEAIRCPDGQVIQCGWCWPFEHVAFDRNKILSDNIFQNIDAWLASLIAPLAEYREAKTKEAARRAAKCPCCGQTPAANDSIFDELPF